MKLSRQLPLNALRVFEAVARLENFTRAAEELGMTQTAVSYQIRLLEEHLGDAVFIRKPRALQLTETGVQLLPKVSEAFALLTDAMTIARHSAGETLEIQSPPTFASHWLSRHLGAFQQNAPHLSVRLTRTMGYDDDKAPNDVAIRIGSKPWDGLICHRIMTLGYTPMLHPKLAASIGGISKPADLLKLPWISDTKDVWTGWFVSLGLDVNRIRHVNLNTFGALDLQANAAIAGHGVAMLSPFFFSEELSAGRLIQPFGESIGDGKSYWLVYPQSRRNTPKVRAFRDWIEQTLVRDLADRGLDASHPEAPT
ncbi:LysR substrate-binding domain-containing protein [Aliirhizobium smilacinae]|uniref:LysR family transcriptional regulator n=1 Tax=Aliirhizobium smilacinae TaxID=1395944 RepID=A0A5C4XIV8_9HYPH|nr:LysR substrate-binding domain-containing protein [Rhizobium smilacinae]TNM62871.1 LysR family transcriptional regulator [Rhizobium smilacinae]